MRARPRVLSILTAALLVALVAPDSRAGGAEQAVDQIVQLNKSALEAFSAGQFDKAKLQLMQAVVLGKENGLNTHPALARTYLHLGVVYLDGLKDKEKASRNFTLALKVRPDIEVTSTLASPTVTAAFAEAKAAGGGAGGEAAKPAAAAPAPAAEAKPQPAPPPPPKAEAKAAEKPAKPEKAEKPEKPAKAEKVAAKPEKASATKTAKTEEPKPAPPPVVVEKKNDAELQALHKELTQAREAEKKERAEKERLQAQLAEKDKQLAEKTKQLAEKDKHLAEAATREKDAAAREKDAASREKKEREAREKLEQERHLAETREKERKQQEQSDRAAREKQLDGPELPAKIPQPVFCASKDEGTAGAELFIHCVPQAQVKAKALVLYYRPSGVAHFDATTMARTRKGWWTGTVPANRVSGKTMQYYVEARGPKEDVVAANGKVDSPNIISLRAAGEAPPKSAAEVAKAAPAKTTARRTPAAQRQRAKPRAAAQH